MEPEANQYILDRAAEIIDADYARILKRRTRLVCITEKCLEIMAAGTIYSKVQYKIVWENIHGVATGDDSSVEG